MKKEPKIGDWYFSLSVRKDYRSMERGWRIFEFAFFKWRKMPDAGCLISKENYFGLFIRFAFWFPIESA